MNKDFFATDESPDESDADPIDAELSNADWPKRTPDTQAAIAESLAALPPSTPFIHGGKWFAWFDYETMDWDGDSEQSPVGMLREEFNESRINEYVDAEKTRLELYEDAVVFLAVWGVKAEVVS